MISYEYVIRKLSQKKQRKKFMHKTKYGRVMGEQFGYDLKGHQEEAQSMKNNPDQIAREYFKN